MSYLPPCLMVTLFRLKSEPGCQGHTREAEVSTSVAMVSGLDMDLDELLGVHGVVLYHMVSLLAG